MKAGAGGTATETAGTAGLAGATVNETTTAAGGVTTGETNAAAAAGTLANTGGGQNQVAGSTSGLAGGALAGLAALLAAAWGAGRKLAPIATGDHQASAVKERVVSVLLVSLSLSIVAGVTIVIVGL